MPETYELVTKGASRQLEGAAGADGDLRLHGLYSALGYELKPEGLCIDAQCFPVPPGDRLTDAQGDSVAGLGRITGRPVALDRDERALAVGEAAATRALALNEGIAPDFALPDLAGRLHRLSDHRGRKVLLAAWASW